MSDTKTILEKRIEQRAEDKVRIEIEKTIQTVPSWILNIRCIRCAGWHDLSIVDFLRSLYQEDYKTFPSPDIKKIRDGQKEKYIREETDKFLTQIDLVTQLTNEVQQYREPINLEDIPF